MTGRMCARSHASLTECVREDTRGKENLDEITGDNNHGIDDTAVEDSFP